MDTRYFGGGLTAVNEIQADRGRASEPAAEDAYYTQNMPADGRGPHRRDEEFRLALASHLADYRKHRALIAAKDGCGTHNPVQSTATGKLRNLAEAGAARLAALWSAVKNRRSVARAAKRRSPCKAPSRSDGSSEKGAANAERTSPRVRPMSLSMWSSHLRSRATDRPFLTALHTAAMRAAPAAARLRSVAVVVGWTGL